MRRKRHGVHHKTTANPGEPDMRYIEEFRDKRIVRQLVDAIHRISSRPISIMEVCGGHTMAIRRSGIPFLLPDKINLLSGPGCPVCVTGRQFIDHAIELSRIPGVIITTYGDLMRVPGSYSTLGKEKGEGGDIRMVYSTTEALKIALNNPSSKVIFLAIGFETTTPPTAVAVRQAYDQNTGNFFILSSHKVMPPAMSALISEGIGIDGYLAPGHVSVITGSSIYDNIAGQYKKGVVISGFEPVDILQSIYMLVDQIEKKQPHVAIQYKRAVHPGGNPNARKVVDEVFEPRDDWWRGLGILPGSGMGLTTKYEHLDAEKVFSIDLPKTREPSGCICGEILKGTRKPTDCVLFGKACTPADPAGSCMVSAEGSCAAYYRYN